MRAVEQYEQSFRQPRRPWIGIQRSADAAYEGDSSTGSQSGNEFRSPGKTGFTRDGRARTWTPGTSAGSPPACSRSSRAGNAASPSPHTPRSAPRYARAASGKIEYPAPPSTIVARVQERHACTTGLTCSRRKRGLSRLWSSMFRTEMPMTSGPADSIALRTAASGSCSFSRSTNVTSCPARRVATATSPSPFASWLWLQVWLRGSRREAFPRGFRGFPGPRPRAVPCLPGTSVRGCALICSLSTQNNCKTA